MTPEFSTADVANAIFHSLRELHGPDTARVMVTDGLSLAVLFDALVHALPNNRDVVRLVTRVLQDDAFVVSPDLGPVWHLKYFYDEAVPLNVVDIAILTMDRGTLASTDVRFRFTNLAADVPQGSS